MIALLFAALMTPDQQLAALDFLAGRWRSADYETVYTTPTGGLVLSASKALHRGRAVFFEFERFEVVEGAVRMHPYLKGRLADVSFPLAELDVAAKRARFANPAHDFPRELTYTRVAPDRLLIVATGEEGGQARELRLDLYRAE